MKIENDKILHFIVCFKIAFVFSVIGSYAMYCLTSEAPGLRTLMGATVGFVITMLIGIEKEWHDSNQPGNHFCWKDILADVAGAIVGCMGSFVSYLV